MKPSYVLWVVPLVLLGVVLLIAVRKSPVVSTPSVIAPLTPPTDFEVPLQPPVDNGKDKG